MLTYTSPFGENILTIDQNQRPYQIRIEPGNYNIVATGIHRGLHFFERDGVEWVHFSTTYYSQQFINLETGETYNNEDPGMSTNFCWAVTKINPSGTIAAVDGCYWAHSYEIKFFDISHPDRGIIEIPIHDIDPDFQMTTGYEFEEYRWLNSTDFEFEMKTLWSSKCNKLFMDLTEEEMNNEDMEDDTTVPLFRLQLRYENGSITYILKESSSDYDRKVMEAKEYEVKKEIFNKNLPSNTRYQQLKRAFPEAQIYLFHHNGCFEDIDSDIQDVHFGAYIKNAKIKSFKDKTIIDEREFLTMEEALSSLSN